jgi:hypothetical protein
MSDTMNDDEQGAEIVTEKDSEEELADSDEELSDSDLEELLRDLNLEPESDEEVKIVPQEYDVIYNTGVTRTDKPGHVLMRSITLEYLSLWMAR